MARSNAWSARLLQSGPEATRAAKRLAREHPSDGESWRGSLAGPRARRATRAGGPARVPRQAQAGLVGLKRLSLPRRRGRPRRHDVLRGADAAAARTTRTSSACRRPARAFSPARTRSVRCWRGSRRASRDARSASSRRLIGARRHDRSRRRSSASRTANRVLVLARFLQGSGELRARGRRASRWLVADAPPNARGRLIGSAMGVAIFGAMLGPVIGGIASVDEHRGDVRRRRAASASGLAVWACATLVRSTSRAASLCRSFCVRADEVSMLTSAGFVALPAISFGALGVLARSTSDALGLGAVAISGGLARRGLVRGDRGAAGRLRSRTAVGGSCRSCSSGGRRSVLRPSCAVLDARLVDVTRR